MYVSIAQRLFQHEGFSLLVVSAVYIFIVVANERLEAKTATGQQEDISSGVYSMLTYWLPAK